MYNWPNTKTARIPLLMARAAQNPCACSTGLQYKQVAQSIPIKYQHNQNSWSKLHAIWPEKMCVNISRGGVRQCWMVWEWFRTKMWNSNRKSIPICTCARWIDSVGSDLWVWPRVFINFQINGRVDLLFQTDIIYFLCLLNFIPV